MGAAPKPNKRTPRRTAPASSDFPRPNRGTASVCRDQLRFHFASMLRMADNLIAKAVGAYDRLFALDPRDEGDITCRWAGAAREDKLDEALESLRRCSLRNR
jgi:hypothetical protein